MPIEPNQSHQPEPGKAAGDETPFTRFLGPVVKVRSGELAIVLWSAVFFFSLMCSYFLVRPVRDAFGLAKGADQLPWLVTATLITMLAVNPVFAAMVSRFSRRVFVPLAFQFAALCLAGFYIAIQSVDGAAKVNLGYVFFVWLSVLNLFAVSIFWASMTDVFTTEQSRRLFGFIAAGGTLGTIAGSALTLSLLKGVTLAGHELKIAPPAMLLVSIVPLELTGLCSWMVFRKSRNAVVRRTAAAKPRLSWHATIEGFAILRRSRYLQLIAMYVLIYSATTTILYYELNFWIERTFPDQAARTAAFANVDLYSNIITFVAQILLTSRAVRWFGAGVTMALVPVITLAGFVVMHRSPTFPVVKWFQILRRSSHFVFDRPARETLYTVLDEDAKFKAKPLIDTAVYRFGDQVSIWITPALHNAGVAIAWLSVPLASLWFGLALVLGRMQRRSADRGRD